MCRIELPTLFALCQCELPQHVFVDMPEDILGIQARVREGNGGDKIDQLAQLGLVNLQAGVLLIQHAL